jgi:hypothetical protein
LCGLWYRRYEFWVNHMHVVSHSRH